MTGGSDGLRFAKPSGQPAKGVGDAPIRILALVSEASCARACLDAAVCAARSQQAAHILALHVRVEPLSLIAGQEEVAVQLLRASSEQTPEKRAEQTRAEVLSWTRTLAPELSQLVSYEEVVGSEEDEVVRAAENAELIVMAKPHNMDGHDAFHASVFRARPPLLLAPASWTPGAPHPPLERHILVAWKRCRQAERAVTGALPWLRRAGKVTVLALDKERGDGGCAPVLERLEHEGVDAGVVCGGAGSHPARILASAGEIGASLIVMGAYRFGPLIEWALGATTKQVISQAKTPLLIAH